MRRIATRIAGVTLALLLSACSEGPDPKASAPERDEEATGASSSESATLAEGRFRRFRAPAGSELTEEQQQRIQELQAIGYVGGSRSPASDEAVTVFDASAAYAGLNFYTSGHAPAAFLMDMEGNRLHEWHLGIEDIWPDRRMDPDNPNQFFWRRAYVYPNGDVLVIFEGIGIAKVSRGSELIWANLNQAHHDLNVLPNGRILVLTRKAHLVPRVNEDEPILEDFVSMLEPDGTTAVERSLLECFENSPFKIDELYGGVLEGDIFHTNSLEPLVPGIAYRVPWMQPGFLLTSMRHLSAMVVVDLLGGRVVKAWKGDFKRQHDPKALPNGNILFFDNRGAEPYSRVIEFDPTDLSAVWQFSGSENVPFYSDTCGTADRLPNGNTLITESDNGRVLEVTHEGQVVWEFYNPHRAGSDREFIATVFELLRIPRSYFSAWSDLPDTE